MQSHSNLPIKQQFHWSRFCLRYHDSRVFAISRLWRSQWVLPCYRMIMMVYVFGWLIAYIVNRAVIKGKKGKTFIAMSVWTYVIFNIAFMLVTFITYKHFINKLRTVDVVQGSELAVDTSTQELTYSEDNISYVEKITWLLYTVSLTMTFMVTVGYYTAAGTNFEDFDVFALHIHGINLLIMCADFMLSQIPIHFLHFYFPTLFVAAYLIFTGIYYAAGGTGAQGRSYIYPLLDYENDLARAILLAVVLVILTAIVHCIFSAVAILRDRVTARYKCCRQLQVANYRISVSGSEAS